MATTFIDTTAIPEFTARAGTIPNPPLASPSDDYDFFSAAGETLKKYVPILTDRCGAGVNIYQGVSGDIQVRPTAQPAPQPVVQPKTDYTPWILGGLALVGVLLITRKK